MIFIPTDKIELVQRFVDTYRSTKDLIDNNDVEGATSKYHELLDVYKQISASKIDQIHKELAYDQLLKVYNEIQNPQKTTSMHATTHIIAAAILLMLFSFMVFFKPVVFGAVAIDQQKVVQDLHWAFIESETRTLHLEALPKSLAITGKVDGNGFVKVYALTPKSRLLVFDADQIKINKDGTFSAACINTCNADLGVQDIALDIEVENAALTIYSIEYKR